MQIEIKIDEHCTESKIIIVTDKVTDEINDIMKKIAGILSYIGIFVVIFVVVWLAQYLSWKHKIKRMNDCFRKR